MKAMTRITGKYQPRRNAGLCCHRLVPGRAVVHNKGRLAILVASSLLLLLYYLDIRSIDDPFDRPFCDPDGTCHEKPDQPSPRTPYSAWNKEQYDRWWEFFYVLNTRAKAYAALRSSIGTFPFQSNNNNTNETDVVDNTDSVVDVAVSASSPSPSPPRPLILLGDSITESWVGTGGGKHNPRTAGIPGVLVETLSGKAGLDPLVLAISGDQTQHLLYRLQNGHLHDEYVTDPSSVFVVMIGTNNLGSGELPEPTATGVLAVVEYLLQRVAPTGGRVMLFEILPRGDGRTVLPKICPPRCDRDGRPHRSFLPAIERVNQALRDGVAQLNKQYTSETANQSPSLTLVDCGKDFLTNKEDGDGDRDVDGEGDEGENGDPTPDVKVELMPDLLHPNAAGHRILASCIHGFLTGLDS